MCVCAHVRAHVINLLMLEHLETREQYQVSYSIGLFLLIITAFLWCSELSLGTDTY